MPSPQVAELQKFLGLSLDGGWTISALVSHADVNHSGGYFSIPFVVRHSDGREAFLKLLDYRRAFQDRDPARALASMTSAFNRERELLYKCRDRRMSRVVQPIGEGLLIPPGESIPIQYLVFEKAQVDARDQLALFRQLDQAWNLRTLHHMAVGLQQLHQAQIAHQDLKPSNVLCFGNLGSKIGDLGRASELGKPAGHDEFPWAGDRGYAPPELLFGAVPNENWQERRFGCDLYLLGSLAVSFYLGIGLTPALIGRVHPSHHPGVWGDGYRQVLPHLAAAFTDVLREFGEKVPRQMREELVAVLRDLGNPDPELRGHALSRQRGNKYDLQRFISAFDRHAQRVELRLVR